MKSFIIVLAVFLVLSSTVADSFKLGKKLDDGRFQIVLTSENNFSDTAVSEKDGLKRMEIRTGKIIEEFAVDSVFIGKELFLIQGFLDSLRLLFEEGEYKAFEETTTTYLSQKAWLIKELSLKKEKIVLDGDTVKSVKTSGTMTKEAKGIWFLYVFGILLPITAGLKRLLSVIRGKNSFPFLLALITVAINFLSFVMFVSDYRIGILLWIFTSIILLASAFFVDHKSPWFFVCLLLWISELLFFAPTSLIVDDFWFSTISLLSILLSIPFEIKSRRIQEKTQKTS